ncbi:MAG: metallophosphoesterase family protein [Akkermansiaceae bacterium]|jgi:predicted phosphodiesterase|nr:metallophosphoesterase family protein [Akkermansiaceae bacterium]
MFADTHAVPKIALLSDIHANLHALRAVLDEIRGMDIDRIVFAGDTVGYGPHPAECVSLVREIGDSVLGNHDFYAITAKRHPGVIPSDPESRTNPVWAGIHHAVHHLQEEDFTWLESLPRLMEIPGAILSHAALHDQAHWPYLLSASDASPTLEMLARCKIDIAFVGHTHRQEWFLMPGTTPLEIIEPQNKFRLRTGSICAVVVGSVGQPRTADNRAAWTLWDSDERSFEFRRTSYPFRETAQAIRDAGLPESSGRRLLGGA